MRNLVTLILAVPVALGACAPRPIINPSSEATPQETSSEFLAERPGGLVPQRQQGLPLHFVPGRGSPSGKSCFLDARHPPDDRESILESSDEVIEYFRSLPPETQKNGMWIVTTHPRAYSAREKELFEAVRRACVKDNIILFVCRGSELPDGWLKGILFSLEDSDAIYEAQRAVTRGWELFRKRDLEGALSQFDEATTTAPGFAPAHFGKAYVYSVQGKLEMAISQYRISIKGDPTHSNSYNNLGLALLYTNKPEEAFSNLQKALEIDSRNGDAHVNMALYYFMQGNYASSWRHIHTAQALKAKVNPGFIRDLRSKMPEPTEAPDKSLNRTDDIAPTG